MFKTIKLLESTKIKITKDENAENVPCLEIAEVVLVRYNILKMITYKIQEPCIHFFPINP